MSEIAFYAKELHPSRFSIRIPYFSPLSCVRLKSVSFSVASWAARAVAARPAGRILRPKQRQVDIHDRSPRRPGGCVPLVLVVAGRGPGLGPRVAVPIIVVPGALQNSCACGVVVRSGSRLSHSLRRLVPLAGGGPTCPHHLYRRMRSVIETQGRSEIGLRRLCSGFVVSARGGLRGALSRPIAVLRLLPG